MALKGVLLRIRLPIIVVMHIAIVIVSYIFAFYIRFDFMLSQQEAQIILRTILVLILVKGCIFYFFNLFSGMWKYVSMEDMWQILKANSAATVSFVLFIVFTHGLIGYPRSVFILDWVLCTGFIAGIRFLSRSFRERFIPIKGQKRKNILIVGAGEAGVLALRELKKNFNFNIIGFVDDDISKRGLQLHGKKIFGGRACVKNIVSKYDISEIIIAMPSATGEVIRNIISCCQFEEVKLRIIPGMYEILSGEVEVKLRDVQPEDLLGRETVKIDEVAITAFVKNKRVLVTGGAGSIGSELVRQIVRFKPERVIIIDHNENDLYFLEREFQGSDSKCGVECIVADCKSVSVLKHVFSKHLPQIVFHTAAFKHVPLMESNLFSAIENNVIGSRNLIYASEHYGVESFVLISSDKAVNPTNIMGATKRITEKLLQAKSQKSRTNFMAVRFGNVLGSKGSVIPLFEKQIKEGKKVTVTHPDVTRFFMTIKEAVQLVVQASTLGKGNGEIFVLDMGEQIKILDFARNLIQLSGLRPEEDIEIEFIGLRPGEKLYEEPLNDIEKGQSTKYDKIFVTRPEKVDIKEIIRQIKQLEGFVRLRDRENAVTKIKEMVPTSNFYFEKIKN